MEQYSHKYHKYLLCSNTLAQAIAFGYRWRKDTGLDELHLASQGYFLRLQDKIQ